MNISKRLESLIKDLKSKKYRDAFAIEHIDTGIPFQIRGIRDQRGWTQKKLAKLTKMKQEAISRIEDPNYGKLTLKTLKRLASAFDVALMIRFVPFSELVKWELNMTPNSLNALSFKEDPYFKDKSEDNFIGTIPEYSLTSKYNINDAYKGSISPMEQLLHTGYQPKPSIMSPFLKNIGEARNEATIN